MGFKVFWTCFDDYCVSRSANPLHDSMYNVWVKKIENFYLFYYLKMILLALGSVLTTFVFRDRQIRYMT